MGPSNNSYLLNAAVFHFNDYGRSRVPPERQRSPHPTRSNTRLPMRFSLISSRLLGLGKLGSIFRWGTRVVVVLWFWLGWKIEFSRKGGFYVKMIEDVFCKFPKEVHKEVLVSWCFQKFGEIWDEDNSWWDDFIITAMMRWWIFLRVVSRSSKALM